MPQHMAEVIENPQKYIEGPNSYNASIIKYIFYLLWCQKSNIWQKLQNINKEQNSTSSGRSGIVKRRLKCILQFVNKLSLELIVLGTFVPQYVYLYLLIIYTLIVLYIWQVGPKKEVVIVGAGISGLTAAYMLLSVGHKVNYSHQYTVANML